MDDFTSIEQSRILYKDNYYTIIKDAYPVSPGHMLIISNELRKDYFELTEVEQRQLNQAILKTKELIESEYKPDGYNIGFNCGIAAGQTIFHFHCHVIPRYVGDMEDPKGGVRHCIPNKGKY